MVDEGDEAPVRRDADAAGPARRFVQHFSNRVLDAVAVSRLVSHGEALSIRRPIGVLHVFEDLARRAAGQRDPRQRADRLETEHEVTIERDRQLAAGRDREDRRARESQRARFRAVGPRRGDVEGKPLPGSCVDDRLGVGSKPGGLDGATRVGQAGELKGRAWPRLRQAAQQEARRDSGREREGRRQDPSAPARPGGFGRRQSAGDRGFRKMVADAFQVASEVLGRGVTLLGVFGEQALDDPANGGRSAGGELSQ